MFTLKEIEKHIDDYILDYIRDACSTRVIKDTIIEQVSENRYKSTYIYANELNEKEYKKVVTNFFATHIEPDLHLPKMKKKKREIGRNITQREFFETLFRDNFEHRSGERDAKGRQIYMRSFLFNIDADERTITAKTSNRELIKMIERAKKYDYFTANMFISHRFFSKEMLTLLGVIVLDFDLDDFGVSMSKEELFRYIEKTINVKPSMIWDTKTPGNYQVAILIEPMTGTPKSVHLYEQIVKEMVFKLKLCDVACANANHIFALGKNSSRTSRFIRKYNDDVHSINEFRWLLNERDERRKREQSQGTRVFDFTKEAVKKHPAIKALFEGENIHWRDHACFTLALAMKFLGDTQDEAENYILAHWQPKVSALGEHPFSEREALKCIKHAYSDKYKCFHSHWVEVCTGIECDLKGYFRAPYQSQGIYVTDTETRFKAFLGKNNGTFTGTINELIDVLNVKRTTLEDVIYKLRDSGQLQYSSQRGRYAKSTFTLVSQVEAVIDYNNVFDVDVELKQIEELDNYIHAM